MAAECAICFEEIANLAQLPCACRVAYCDSCWDRALSESVMQQGVGRCPSCRMPIRIDINSETGALIFSPEPNDPADLDGEDWEAALNDNIERIAYQAMPVQIRKLQAYAQEHAISQPTTSELSLPAHVAQLIEAGQEAPRCVCRGVLRRMQLALRLQDSPSAFLICDLCGEEVDDPDCFTWTCDNGGKTVMHSASYDICDSCFGRHTERAHDSAAA
eukprot:gb/GFBE01025126.1/.p1 GENE.gb/GFBE01025126.1/~~gb/GFBE01025126.1/.p1  ORF type:complete len:217 (+),score=38.86 gb/GFBE01025126.1/:1-651(+)